MPALLLTPAEVAHAARVLERRIGLHFATSITARLEGGLRRAMANAGVERIEEFLEHLERCPRTLEVLVDDLTVGETYFFRDPRHFAFIRSTILPDLRARRGTSASIGVWSAGCASGEEAYSLAILLEQEGAGDAAHILATDVSRAQLARAREGIYGAWSLRGEGAAAVAPYLRRSGERFVLDEAVRRRVDLRHLNLVTDAYPSFATGTWGRDLILCRNVLIYFSRETVARVAAKLYASLAEGGWLITGPSDPLLTKMAPFEVVVTDAGVVYRRLAREEEPGRRRLDSERQRPPRATRPRQARAIAAVAPPVDPIEEARSRFQAGDYAGVVQLTAAPGSDPVAAALRVRALANLSGPAVAERAATEAARRHPLSTELHFLRAVLLAELGNLEEATAAARRVVYLDRSLEAAHFLLGSVLVRRGEVAGAKRAYRNAYSVSAARPADDEVPLGDGERAGRLAAAAAAQLEILERGA